jgi:uncharacterized protein YqfB (UPF0267 family)
MKWRKIKKQVKRNIIPRLIGKIKRVYNNENDIYFVSIESVNVTPLAPKSITFHFSVQKMKPLQHSEFWDEFQPKQTTFTKNLKV